MRIALPPRRWLARHLRFGGYSQMHALVADLLFRADVLIIGGFLASTEVGLYAFASDVAKGLTVAAVLIQINFNPVISRLWTERKKADLAAYVARVRKHTYLVHVPIVALAAVGYPVFVYLFKAEMAVPRHFAAYYILLGGVFVYSGYAALLGLTAYTGHVRHQLVRSVAALAVNAAGSVLLVPVLGIAGAAVSTCLAFGSIIVYMKWFARTQLGLDGG
jgi:O-antigen/teichoic acid export membrane protein